MYSYDRRAQQSMDAMERAMRPVVDVALRRVAGGMSVPRAMAYMVRSLDAIRRRSWLAHNSETDDDYRHEYAPRNAALRRFCAAVGLATDD